RLCRDRAGQGLPAGRRLAPDPLELSRRRRFPQNAGGARRAAREGLMPRHSETRYLPYTPEQLFELVADVEHYDEFLPWVVAVRVVSSKNFWSATIFAGSALRSAVANTTVPTGLEGEPPPGPAMPVIATAISASDAASAPRAIAQAVATLTAPKVSTTSSLTL